LVNDTGEGTSGLDKISIALDHVVIEEGLLSFTKCMLNNIVWVVYAPSPICTKSQLKLEGFENAVRVTLVILETGGALGKRFNTMFGKMYSKMFNKRAGVGPSMRAEQQQTAP
jgi:hypothetical protein